jgi:hypothetical protein
MKRPKCSSGIDVATEKPNGQIRTLFQQLALSAQTGRPDDRPFRQFIQRLKLIGYESIAWVFTLTDDSQPKPNRKFQLDDGEYDAIILAAAGLIRLEMQARIKQFLSVSLSLPAGGQGAVGIECRTLDEETKMLIKPLHHTDTATCVLAERAMNRRLEGGCQVPIA